LVTQEEPQGNVTNKTVTSNGTQARTKLKKVFPLNNYFSISLTANKLQKKKKCHYNLYLKVYPQSHV
jgi:hypothetical protein